MKESHDWSHIEHTKPPHQARVMQVILNGANRRMFNRRLIVTLLVIIAIFSIMQQTHVASASPVWWDSSYSSRRSITLTYASSLTDTQILYNTPLFTSLYSAGKLRADCNDIRFVDNSNNPLLYFTEVCDTTGGNSLVQIQASVTPPSSTIWMYYGKPSATSGSLSWSGSIIVMTTLSSPPSGWTSLTGMTGRMPRGSTTSGTTGGDAAHPHTITSSSIGASNGQGAALVGTFWTVASAAHYHSTLNNGAAGSTTALPPYMDYLFISRNSLPYNIPANSIIMINGTIPSGWAQVTQLTDRIPRSGTYTGIGGGSATHTHLITGTLSGAIGTAQCDIPQNWIMCAYAGHTHTVSITSAAASSYPDSFSVVYMQNSALQPLQSGSVLMFQTALPPLGWTRVSGLDNRYPLGGNTFGTIGSGVHAHTFSGQSDSPGNTDHSCSYGPPYVAVQGAGHTHPVSGSTSSVTNLPPYYTMIFGQRVPSLPTITVGNEERTVYDLNLKIVAFDGTTVLTGASVTMNNGTDQVKTISSSGWANYTVSYLVTAVTIKVKWENSWVNGTFTQTMGADRTVTVVTKVYSSYALNWRASDNSTTFTPTSVQLLAPNSTLVTLSGSAVNSLPRVQNGTWTVVHVFTQDNDVAPTPSPTFSPTGNSQSRQIACNIYAVTFSTTGPVGSDASGTILTVNSVAYTYSDVGGSNTKAVTEGSLTYAFMQTIPSTISGKQYVWTSTSGTAGQTAMQGTFTPTASGTIIGNYKIQYLLTVNSAHGTPGGAGWYDSGSTPTATITPLTVSGGTGIQYVFTGWSGDASGLTSPSNPITMNGPKTATANWKTQYWITVTSEYGSPTPSGWVDSGQNYLTGVTSPDGGYRCDGYKIDDGTLQAGTSYTFTNVQAAHTVKYQWSLNTVSITVTSSPVGLGFISVDGSSITTPQVFVWTIGDTHTLVASSSVSEGTGVQYIFQSWDDGGVQTHVYTVLSSSATVTANYQTQYWLAMQTGLGGSVSPSSGWQNSGASVQVTATPDAWYAFVSWTGSGTGSRSGTDNPVNVTMNDPITETASFQVITVSITITSDPLGTGFVKVDDAAQETPYTTSWVTGSSHTIEALSPVSSGENSSVRYVWASWNDSGARVHTISVTSSATFTASFMKQYRVTFASEGIGTDASNAVVTVNGVVMFQNQLPYTGWYNSGSTIPFAFASPVPSTEDGKEYYWNCTTSDLGQTYQSGSLTVVEAGTITGVYMLQYRLTMITNPESAGITSPTVGSSWYLSGTAVVISASAGEGWVFLSWAGTGSGSYSGDNISHDVVISGVVTETACFGRELDHFVISTVGQQSTRVPFTITITAVDQYGNTVTQFTGTVTLSDSTGTITPPSTGSFSGGVWTGPVTITAAQTGIVITVTGGGKSGSSTSNNFNVIPSLITMAVSYVIVDGGSGYSAPTFNYVQEGQNKTYILTGTPVDVLCDDNSVWSISSNPLDGSGSSERWYTTQNISGVISSQQIMLFSYQHQYYLTVRANPLEAGTTVPISDWHDAGDLVQVSATAHLGWQFEGWAGSGAGNYAGSSNPADVTMLGAVTETAGFTRIFLKVVMTVNFSVVGSGEGYSAPAFNYTQDGISKQQTLTSNPEGISMDQGSVWSVSPNPLGGSGQSERWVSNQSLMGNATGAATISFVFQHQCYLTMSVSPLGTGSLSPGTGWQNATASVSIQTTANTGYSFVSWQGSGDDSYTGTDNPVTIIMNAPVEEVANFVETIPLQPQVAVTVYYRIVNGGTGYTAPTFNYVQNGQNKTYQLTKTQTPIECDSDSSWFVSPNPLSGSSQLSQWYSSQPLSGTASAQTLLFQFQYQYYLTMRVVPSGSGTVNPVSGWQDAGDSVQVSASAGNDYVFTSWMGGGSGSYTGTNNPVTVIMNETITETANFSPQIKTQNTCTFGNSAAFIAGTQIVLTLPSEAPFSVQQLILPLSQVLAAPGFLVNRKDRRDLARFGGVHRAHHGLSTVTITVVLIVLGVVAVVATIALYTTMGAGAGQSTLSFTGSTISINAQSNSGTVYIKMFNAGSSSARVRFISVTGKAGAITVDFSSGRYGIVSIGGCNCTISGESRVSIGGSVGNGFILVPSGATAAITLTFPQGMMTYFEPSNQYHAKAVQADASDVLFSIRS